MSRNILLEETPILGSETPRVWVGVPTSGTGIGVNSFVTPQAMYQSKENFVEFYTNSLDMLQTQYQYLKTDFIKEGYSEISPLIFKKSLIFVARLFNQMKANHASDFPDITFSPYDGSLDLSIYHGSSSFLISIYEDQYAIAFSDPNENDWHDQNEDLNEILQKILKQLEILNSKSSISVTVGYNNINSVSWSTIISVGE